MDKIDINKSFEIKKLSNYIKKNSINIEFFYVSDFHSAKILRDIIHNMSVLLKIDSINISRIILIIDEMNNNAIEYWSKKWEINKLRFKAEIKNNNSVDLNIEVEDSGNWKQAKKALEMETLRAHQLKLWYLEHASIRWRGLFMIIVNLVDRLYFKDNKTWWLIVWIKKTIKI